MNNKAVSEKRLTIAVSFTLDGDPNKVTIQAVSSTMTAQEFAAAQHLFDRYIHIKVEDGKIEMVQGIVKGLTSLNKLNS